MKFNLLDLLLPRETKFFDYLNRLSDHVYESCVILHDTATRIETLSKDELKKRLYAIKDHEVQGEQLELVVIEELWRCFITPLDREDIHSLTVGLNRPLNVLKDLADKIEIYRIRKLPVNACRFTEIAVTIAKLQQEVVHGLHGKPTTRKKIERMNKLENQADELFNASLGELFGRNEEILTAEVVKLKEVYEMLEEIVDGIDDVGKLVRGIMIKHG